MADKKGSTTEKVRIRHNGPKARSFMLMSLGGTNRAARRMGDGREYPGGVDYLVLRFGARLSKTVPLPIQEVPIKALPDLQKAINEGTLTILRNK